MNSENIVDWMDVNKKTGFNKRLTIAITLITIISAICLALVVGCTGKAIKDMSDNDIRVNGEVKSIACLWPTYTDSLIALGLGDKISAVSSINDEYMNAWAKKIYPGCTKYNNLCSTSPSVDELKSLNVDLVILNPETFDSNYQKELLDAGIPAADLRYASYEDLKKSLNIVGSLLDSGSCDVIKKYCSLLDSKLEKSKEFHNDEALKNPSPGAYLTGHDMDVQTVYPQCSPVREWFDYNTGVDVMEQYNVGDTNTVPVSVLRLANHIFIGGPYKNYIKNELTTSDIWRACSAVEDGTIYFSPTGVSSWGDIGVESVLMMDFALVHMQPIIVQKCNITMNDVIAQAKDFYRDFSHVELTDADINNMLNNCGPDGASVDKPVSF